MSRTMQKTKMNYGEAIRSAFEYLLDRYPEVFVIGQGLWSPWYVGNSMTDLDKKFGTDRVIDTPVSESACTGAAVGAALAGMRPVVVHPRMDFMLYAMDAIVNQAAKWSHMVGGQAHPSMTIRAIINRGGEQGAQHSQALHSWFAHVPGLRVVMPSTVRDARDMLIASVLCDDPVMFIDDRWLYDQEEELDPVVEIELSSMVPLVTSSGTDVSLVGVGHAALLTRQAAQAILEDGISSEVIDVRVLNPLNPAPIVDSVRKTGRLVVVDPGTRTAGYAAELITSVVERLSPGDLKSSPIRVTLPDAPAPTSSVLEKAYYTSVRDIVDIVNELLQ